MHRTFKNFILYILIQRGELKDHVSQVGSNWLHQFIKSTLTEKAYKFNRPDQFKLSSTIKDEFTISLAQDDFTHVVDELIRNAFKFSESGTTVSVNISGNETGFTVSVSNQTSDANFFDQAEAFKQFNREQKEQQGSGLGLYLSKKIAEIHRWKLTGTYQENTVTLSLEVKA